MLMQGNCMCGIATKQEHSREAQGKYQLISLYVMVHQKAAIATKKSQTHNRDHLFRAEITSLQIRWTEELKRGARLGCMNVHKEHSNSAAKPGPESSSIR